jgi:thiol-disulfide isomerase/thioredoxin
MKRESFEDGTKQVEMLLFFADWCPHCKAAKPVWSELIHEYETKTINGYHVLFTEVDCTNNDNPEIVKKMDQYNVNGFPTIKLIKDGKVIDFDAKPTKPNLENFLNTMV